MKKLFFYMLVSLLVVGMAGCSDELFVEGSNNSQAGKGLTVTGTILQDETTRVALTDNGTSITPAWEVDDEIFGFYGESNTLTYKVTSVDAGVATFTLDSGTEPGDGTTVYMIYAPGKSTSDLSTNQLAVDLSTQDGTLAGVKNHAVMCATATVSGSTLDLKFENQVAIVGVQEFTGLKEGTTYTSATFTSAGPQATVKVVDGKLKLVTDDVYGTITATGTFQSDASGCTSSTIYFAVPPTSAVAHTFCLHSTDDHRAGNISPKALASGKFVYMTTKAMSKTLYFDDFEGWSADVLPSDLSITTKNPGNGSTGVVENSKNGSHGLRIYAGSNCCVVYNNNSTFTSSLASEISKGSEIILEAYMKEIGTVSGSNFDFGLWNTRDSHPADYAVAYGNSQKICFGLGGNNKSSNTDLIKDKWYHLKIQYIDIHSNLLHKAKIWIDGVLFTNGELDYFEKAGGVSVNTFRFCENNSSKTVVFDDVIVYSKPSAAPSNPSGVLGGEFSISESQKVKFSKGNLQYQASTDSWRFATHQYDFIGQYEGNTTASIDARATQSSWIDWYGWGSSGYNEYGAKPYNNSLVNSFFKTQASSSDSEVLTIENKADWGYAYNTSKSATGWYTLTKDQFNYLLNTRTASTVNSVENARYAKVTINGIHGLLLFPDAFTWSASMGTAPTTINASAGTTWDSTDHTLAEFDAMETAGAVFLPAAGYHGSVDGYKTDYGAYWTATASGENTANSFDFSSERLQMYGTNRGTCCSVRLVRNVE